MLWDLAQNKAAGELDAPGLKKDRYRSSLEAELETNLSLEVTRRILVLPTKSNTSLKVVAGE